MLNILIIDDSLTIRKMLKKILTDLGCNVIATANSAKEGIELYKKCKPDLVTMDVNMPEMTGMEALKIIREDDKDAKIIMLTSKGDNALVAQAIKYGAKGYVLKPPSENKLKNAIEAVFPNEFAPKVEENKEFDIQNYESSIKDTLTDFYTVQYMHYTVQHLIEIHDKIPEMSLSLIIVSVDNLDNIASELGSIEKDILSTQIADEIQMIIEESDIPVKLSSKEFAIFSVGTSQKDMQSISKKIRFRVDSIKTSKLIVSTSITHHQQYEKLIHFLERAEETLK